MLDKAKPYLVNIETHYPSYYDIEIRRTISSYALYTRKLMGDLDIAKGQKLLREAGGPEKLGMEADAWLLGTFAGNAAAASERKAIVRHVLNKVSETAGAANFTVGYGDGAYLLLSSDRRVDAVMLESLIQEQKDLDLIPKIVTGLLAHRKAGRWLNTQENTYALLAMDLYFNTYEKTTPDFTARVWLGDDYAGDHAFKGRSTDYFAIPISMKDVAAHDKQVRLPIHGYPRSIDVARRAGGQHPARAALLLQSPPPALAVGGHGVPAPEHRANEPAVEVPRIDPARPPLLRTDSARAGPRAIQLQHRCSLRPG